MLARHEGFMFLVSKASCSVAVEAVGAKRPSRVQGRIAASPPKLPAARELRVPQLRGMAIEFMVGGRFHVFLLGRRGGDFHLILYICSYLFGGLPVSCLKTKIKSCLDQIGWGGNPNDP